MSSKPFEFSVSWTTYDLIGDGVVLDGQMEVLISKTKKEASKIAFPV